MTSPYAPSPFIRYITPGEAARMMSVNRQQVWELVRARRLRYRFDPAGRCAYLVAKPDARAGEIDLPKGRAVSFGV